VDVAIECGGRAQAIDDSIAATRKGGRIVLLAVIGTPVPIDTWAIVEGERTVTGSVQHHFDEDLPIAVDLMASGQVDVRPLITRRIPLDRVVTDGFAALEAGGSDIKVLVSTRAPTAE
jgi:(R,R)-butanediol dehydrogenase/meso-butanediol dehydrogenase/diacetyl reductase